MVITSMAVQLVALDQLEKSTLVKEQPSNINIDEEVLYLNKSPYRVTQ